MTTTWLPMAIKSVNINNWTEYFWYISYLLSSWKYTYTQFCLHQRCSILFVEPEESPLIFITSSTHRLTASGHSVKDRNTVFLCWPLADSENCFPAVDVTGRFILTSAQDVQCKSDERFFNVFEGILSEYSCMCTSIILPCITCCFNLSIGQHQRGWRCTFPGGEYFG